MAARARLRHRIAGDPGPPDMPTATRRSRRDPYPRRPLALALALLALGGCGAADVRRHGDGTAATRLEPGALAAEAPAQRQRGVSWVASRRPIDESRFAPLVEANVEWIAQTPFGWQEHERSPEVRLVSSGRVHWGETDEGLEATTRLARRLGIATLLKPHVWIVRPGEGAWVGELGPGSDADWERWFASYRRFALHYAALAERLGVEAFCVGTELHRTVRERPDEWRRLIAEVRQVYSGRLTYAANWHREVEDVPFWDALDLIGVQGYFPLAASPLPTVAELDAGWRPHVATLEALARRHRKPILFTEVGYVSRPGAAAEPWLWPERRRESSGADGLEAQARAYEAFFRAFWHRPWVAGAFFWKWYPEPPAGATEDYSPQGKPAERVLARWYGAGR